MSPSPRSAQPPAASRFELLGEALGTLVLVGLLCGLLVPALPAVTAGMRQLRRQREGLTVRWIDQLRCTWQVLSERPSTGLAVLGPAALSAAAALAAASGLPHGGAYLALLAVVWALTAQVVLRAATLWAPGERWLELVERAAGHSTDDVKGSMVVVATIVAATAIAFLVPPLAVLVPGILCLATLAATERGPAALRAAGRGR
ncbi:hypothetical protein [Pedococcus sp. 5OH_020]|uniref:hypothetical protein n=1 Tax=Pedococcus sp. 5OH_020 TaxID=2989814 RepID=UPI0022E9C1ED|nr:hypothetical protein [Pedococcus sp. 5OH_020]